MEMTTTAPRPPVAPGEAAPNFTLPAAHGSEIVSLADYRGRSPVFLALLLGLWCPFCRRQIAQMGTNEAKLKSLGVETVGIVATPPENAKLYFKFRPTRLRLGADPELATHRAYGVPKPAVTPELMEAIGSLKVNPTGELPEPLPITEAATKLGQIDGYASTNTDQTDMEKQFPQLKGYFLIDRDGVVRWTRIECSEGLEGIGKFPSEHELVAAVQALPR
jgi:peroxiredoxin